MPNKKCQLHDQWNCYESSCRETDPIIVPVLDESLAVACCPTCGRPVQDHREYGPWFHANWPGQCNDCGRLFDEGEIIRSCTHGYSCQECAS